MTYNLFHYYDKDIGPFKNLSSLSLEAAQDISDRLRLEGATFAGQRASNYNIIRRELEQSARKLFMSKGGKPKHQFPHYLTVESCDWLESWYRKPGKISLPWEDFAEESISFTYGDLFPTMRYEDQKPYRKQVYTKNEIIGIIDEFGLPQVWNRGGNRGPERYIEVQVWDEDVIKNYL